MLGVGHGEVLDAVVAMGDQASQITTFTAAGPDRLLNRVEGTPSETKKLDALAKCPGPQRTQTVWLAIRTLTAAQGER